MMDFADHTGTADFVKVRDSLLNDGLFTKRFCITNDGIMY